MIDNEDGVDWDLEFEQTQRLKFGDVEWLVSKPVTSQLDKLVIELLKLKVDYSLEQGADDIY